MENGENKRCHLQMIQSVVDRLAGDSFRMKEWSIVLVSALLALSVNRGQATIAPIAFIPALLFWILDAYFLRQERLFRALYNVVRMKSESDIDFSMDTSALPDTITFSAGAPATPVRVDSWLATMFKHKRKKPNTLLIFHGMIVLSVLLVSLSLFVFVGADKSTNGGTNGKKSVLQLPLQAGQLASLAGAKYRCD